MRRQKKESVVQRLRRRRAEIDAGIKKKPRDNKTKCFKIYGTELPTTAEERKRIKKDQDQMQALEWQLKERGPSIY